MTLQKHLRSVKRKRDKDKSHVGEGVFVMDRRKHTRVKVELPLDYFPVGGIETHGGIVTNASEGGLLVRLMEDIRIGAVLKIGILFVMKSELNLIKATARVIWSKLANKKTEKEYRYGLQFQSLPKGDLHKLKTLLKEA